MLHWGVAISMDLLVIGREVGFTNVVRVVF